MLANVSLQASKSRPCPMHAGHISDHHGCHVRITIPDPRPEVATQKSINKFGHGMSEEYILRAVDCNYQQGM